MRTRTKGIQITAAGERIVEKQYRGKRIFSRLGKVSQEDAEGWLRQRQAAIDVELAKGTSRDFASAAGRYLDECERKGLRSIDSISQHVTLAVNSIGKMSLESIHSEALQDFIEERLTKDKVTPTTVNKTLGVIRSILLRASRVWRNDDGTPWLCTAPLIEMLDESPRQPYPITWEEQNRLLPELPDHLARMALFAVNTGLRSSNIYGLRWSWERRIKELGCSVFVIPAEEFKTKRPHVAVLNDVAASIIEQCRGKHAEFVFTYKNESLPGKPILPIESINNTAWKKARTRAGLPNLRVHDLRHTFAHRLRDAGVSAEDRSVLMGHATTDMASHYATATISNLIDMANKVSETIDVTTILRVVQKSHAESHAERKTA